MVTWMSYAQDGHLHDIFARRYTSDGSAAGDEFQVNQDEYFEQLYPFTTGLVDGRFLVTWTSDQFGTMPIFKDIFARLYEVDGTPVGDEFRINQYTDRDQAGSANAALADGGSVVTWDSSGQEGHSPGVYGRRYGADGGQASDEFLISRDILSASAGSSAVAGLEDGGFVVSWTSYFQDGDLGGIYARRFGADGRRWATSSGSSKPPSGRRTKSAITALVDGEFVVTWASSDQTASGAIHTFNSRPQRWARASLRSEPAAIAAPSGERNVRLVPLVPPWYLPGDMVRVVRR